VTVLTRSRRLIAVAAGATITVLTVAACSSPSAGIGRSVVEPSVSGEASGAQTHAGHSVSATLAAAPLRPGERFVTVTMPQPYTPAAPSGGIDEYRCFVIDPQLKRPAFLTGSQFLPQNANIVHHAIFFRISRTAHPRPGPSTPGRRARAGHVSATTASTTSPLGSGTGRREPTRPCCRTTWAVDGLSGPKQAPPGSPRPGRRARRCSTPKSPWWTAPV
jgi:hypothetical protein